jgi:hypothetical protein
MPKVNSSYVKICESSHPRLAQKFSIVTRAVVVRTILLTFGKGERKSTKAKLA